MPMHAHLFALSSVRTTVSLQTQDNEINQQQEAYNRNVLRWFGCSTVALESSLVPNSKDFTACTSAAPTRNGERKNQS